MSPLQLHVSVGHGDSLCSFSANFVSSAGAWGKRRGGWSQLPCDQRDFHSFFSGLASSRIPFLSCLGVSYTKPASVCALEAAEVCLATCFPAQLSHRFVRNEASQDAGRRLGGRGEIRIRPRCREASCKQILALRSVITVRSDPESRLRN